MAQNPQPQPYTQTITASDPEGTNVTITAVTDLTSIPGTATLTANGPAAPASETFSWDTTGVTTSYSGTVTFRATDATGASTDQTVNISTFFFPNLTSIGPQAAQETVQTTFSVTANTAEPGATLAITMTIIDAITGTQPTLTSNGGGSETFDWTPDAGTAGTYDIKFTVTQTVAGKPTTTDEETVTFTVTA